jgi:N-methylhydantoinase B
VVTEFEWKAGDIVIFNDPFKGGTHLPDVTLIMPVFVNDQLTGFVANRAHHADIGSDEPGSMPLSSRLSEEGTIISPQYLGRSNQIDPLIYKELFQQVQNTDNTQADLNAQLSANLHGAERLQQLIGHLGWLDYKKYTQHLLTYAESMATSFLQKIPDGEYHACDLMDDDGLGNVDIPIAVTLTVSNGKISVDFSGTASQVSGNINCPKAVTAAAVYYAFRCLMNNDVPACMGAFRPIDIITERGSLVDAQYPAAVAAGNVETSSRIVDVIFAALSQLDSLKIPADSQGTMNNIAMGCNEGQPWSYYETIGGGAGANVQSGGLDAVQTHMTNTQNTPVEVMEMAYPLRITRYAIREGSGGAGKYNGGDGIIREFEFLQSAKVSILSERRRHPPRGFHQGQAGATGQNFFNDELIDGKVSLGVNKGDRIRIETPGGGAYGKSTEAK